MRRNKRGHFRALQSHRHPTRCLHVIQKSRFSRSGTSAKERSGLYELSGPYLSARVPKRLEPERPTDSCGRLRCPRGVVFPTLTLGTSGHRWTRRMIGIIWCLRDYGIVCGRRDTWIIRTRKNVFESLWKNSSEIVRTDPAL